MATNETRLLVLSFAVMFSPINGYQMRRQLLDWEVDKWAHTQPGSLYSALSTLAKHGFLRRHDIDDSGRSVAVYELTPQGEAEHDRLHAEALRELDITHLLGLFTSVHLARTAKRQTFLQGLRERRAAHEAALAFRDEHRPVDVPTATACAFALEDRLIAAEIEWLDVAISDIEKGGLNFRDDPGPWPPTRGTLVRETLEESARYRRRLKLPEPQYGFAAAEHPWGG